MSVTLVVLFLIVNALGALADVHVVSVETRNGIVNGFTENVTFSDKTSKLHMFLRIPFAEPPVNDLRFKKPVPISSWNEPLDAFSHGDACIQNYATPNVSYSEDCLYLNVYAPNREDPNVKLPVMIWIYGGGFHFGEANWYIPDRLAVTGDVIVVTFNYRMGILGFLSTGDAASPGNYGLWDQQLAIKWVHDNIAAFGGDVNNVTLFGESAGSAGVIYQGLYTENHGLFQRMIAQSGSVSASWGSTKEGPENARKVAHITNCSSTDSFSLIKCLRGLPARHLINLVTNPPDDIILQEYTFFPVKDDDFVKFDAKTVFQSADRESMEAVEFLSSLDLLTGVVVGEGISGLDPEVGVNDPINFLPDKTEFETTLVPMFIKYGFGEEYVDILDNVIISKYTNWTDPENRENIREQFLQMHADFGFNGPLYQTLNAHAQNGATGRKTYMYFLDFEPETKLIADFPWYKKAVHADDLPLVFAYRLQTGWPIPTPADWELEMAKQTMMMWTNFAKTGDPNTPADIGLNWTPYTIADRHYLHFTRDMTSSNVKQRWNLGARYFWTDVIHSLVQSNQCHSYTRPPISSSAGLSIFGLPSLLILTSLFNYL